MLIGLTGQIGAGKSEAARILKKQGAFIVDADKIGHQVVRASKALRKELCKEFSEDIFDRQGRLLRKKLAQRAFLNSETKDQLNSIIHPYLLKELRQQIIEGLKSNDVVVIDAALLLYWEMDNEVDIVLVIHASRQERYDRLIKRGITPEEASAREEAQLPYSEFRKRADFLLLNNGTPKDLEQKVRKLWYKLRVTNDN